jgi:Flp pilus assembly protein TadB
MDSEELKRKRAEIERQVERAERLVQESERREAPPQEVERQLAPRQAPLSPDLPPLRGGPWGGLLRVVVVGIVALVVIMVVYRILMSIVLVLTLGVLVLGGLALIRAWTERER